MSPDELSVLVEIRDLLAQLRDYGEQVRDLLYGILWGGLRIGSMVVGFKTFFAFVRYFDLDAFNHKI